MEMQQSYFTFLYPFINIVTISTADSTAFSLNNNVNGSNDVKNTSILFNAQNGGVSLVFT